MVFGLRSENASDRTWKRIALISSILASLTVVARYGGDCAVTYMRSHDPCKTGQSYASPADYNTETSTTGITASDLTKSSSLVPEYDALAAGYKNAELPAQVKSICNMVRDGLYFIDGADAARGGAAASETSHTTQTSNIGLDNLVSPPPTLTLGN